MHNQLFGEDLPFFFCIQQNDQTNMDDKLRRTKINPNGSTDELMTSPFIF